MLQQMLNLDGSIKGDIRKLFMQSTSNAHGMGWAIKEIGITKGDVACSLSYLGTNICQDNLGWYSKETSSINRSDGAMQARMFTAACRLSIACKSRRAIQLQMSITIKCR